MTYYTIVTEKQLNILIKDGLKDILPPEQIELFMISMGYDNDKYVYNLRNCAQHVYELEDGRFCVTAQLKPNLPPYKSFFNIRVVDKPIKSDELLLVYAAHGKDNVFDDKVFKTLEFKENVIE